MTLFAHVGAVHLRSLVEGVAVPFVVFALLL